MYSKSKEWINRYPVCALVYKEAAEMMGYSINEAKSLAMARATFFAAAKSGWGWNPKGYAKKAPSKSSYTRVKDLTAAGADPKSQEELLFCGVGTHIVEVGDEIRAIFGGKLQQPDDYDKKVENKLRGQGDEAFVKVVDYVKSRLLELQKYELNTQSVYKVYETLRDKVRQRSFIDDSISSEANIHITG